MCFIFRKSARLGPFRVNLSKSGVGLSAGVPGFRVTQSSNGRRYTTFNAPGTGMSYRTSSTSSKPSTQGCLVSIVALLGLAVVGVCFATST